MKKDQIKQAAEAAAASAKDVVIEQPNRVSVCLEITGRAPLIQNKFSQKAVEEMLRKHMGISVQREKKKPREVIEAAMIKNMAERICVPPTGIKKAMLTAAAQIKGLKKTHLRTTIFVEGQSIPIVYSNMTPRMDMVRTSGIARTPDVRFRPQFNDWKARLLITFSDTISVQTVVDLLNRAGDVGLCEWRPDKDGTFGTFRVTRNIEKPEEVAEVREECAVALIPLRIPDWAMDADIDPMVLAKIMKEQETPSEEETEPVNDDVEETG
jgi:hypothetical protein